MNLVSRYFVVGPLDFPAQPHRHLFFLHCTRKIIPLCMRYVDSSILLDICKDDASLLELITHANER